MRLLIVEDDATIADFIAKGLTEAGFAVDVAADGARGLELAASGAYDVAIVDIMLPQLDGLTLIDRMRARGVRTPVLILSARRTVDDRVAYAEQARYRFKLNINISGQHTERRVGTVRQPGVHEVPDDAEALIAQLGGGHEGEVEILENIAEARIELDRPRHAELRRVLPEMLAPQK